MQQCAIKIFTYHPPQCPSQATTNSAQLYGLSQTQTVSMTSNWSREHSGGSTVEMCQSVSECMLKYMHTRVLKPRELRELRKRLTFFFQHRGLSKYNVFLPHQHRQCFHKFTPHQFGHTNKFSTFRISAVEQDTILAHQQNVRRKGFGPFVFVVLFEIPRDGACTRNTEKGRGGSGVFVVRMLWECC